MDSRSPKTLLKYPFKKRVEKKGRKKEKNKKILIRNLNVTV